MNDDFLETVTLVISITICIYLLFFMAIGDVEMTEMKE